MTCLFHVRMDYNVPGIFTATRSKLRFLSHLSVYGPIQWFIECFVDIYTDTRMGWIGNVENIGHPYPRTKPNESNCSLEK